MLLSIIENKTKTDSNLRVAVQLSKEIMLDSGSYRHRFTITEKKLINSGTYILIVSTYHSGQIGEFIVTIDSSVAIVASPIS